MIVVSFVLIFFSIVIHEYAHGWMAERLGDPTARYAGRLTLNPVSHIDLMGTIMNKVQNCTKNIFVETCFQGQDHS